MNPTSGQANPDWTTDEAILLLNLYLELSGVIPSKADSRVIALSTLLQSLPIHKPATRGESFRNVDGIVLKLQNLRHVATGKGLNSNSKVDVAVWNMLGADPARTMLIANAIRSGATEMAAEIECDSDDIEFAEGRILTVAHKRRERNPLVRQRLLATRRRSGMLTCEICRCVARPTPYGEAVFEVHHIRLLSSKEGGKTHLREMALLCANCHRSIHRAIAHKKRWLTIEDAIPMIIA